MYNTARKTKTYITKKNKIETLFVDNIILKDINIDTILDTIVLTDTIKLLKKIIALNKPKNKLVQVPKIEEIIPEIIPEVVAIPKNQEKL